MEEELRDLLENGKDWEHMKTTVPGLFIRKIPASKKKPASLAVEINPPDESGNPTKKTGMMIRGLKELSVFREIISLKKIDEVLEVIERISPHQAEEKRVLKV